jgi:hypothetical protein
MNTLMWRIYYGDGTTFDNTDGKPPVRDVQVIIQQHPDVGWHTMCKYDYYVWWGERWQGVDEIGLYDLLEELGLMKPQVGSGFIVRHLGKWIEVSGAGFYAWLKELEYVLLGRTMTTKRFREVMTRAVKDMGAQKTGWLRDERRLNG